MGEKQEKVWVVLQYVKDTGNGPRDNYPAKVFDDRKDARAYTANANKRSRKYSYFIAGVKKG